MKKLCLVFSFIVLLLYTPSSVLAQTIKINEFSSADNPEWIELYNYGESEVNLAGWKILFDGSSESQNITLNENDTVTAKSFKIVERNYTGTVAWLKNNGDTIILKDLSNNVQDSIKYGDITGADVSAPSPGQSAGRNPDGNGRWTIFSSPTKGSANNISSTPTNTPISTPIPTNTPFPTTPPTSEPTPTKTPLRFNISSVPSSITSSQSFSINIKASGWDSNSKYYLKGAFIKESLSGNYYFGKNKVSSNWIKNNQEWSSQFSVQTDSSSSWEGNLEIMVDETDSDFTGSGEYLFKVGRRQEGNEQITWSESFKINIIDQRTIHSPTPTPTPTPTKKITPTPTTTKSTTKNVSPTSLVTTSKANTPESILARNSSTPASVLGTSSDTNQSGGVKPKQKLNPFMIIGGGILVIIGINMLVYFIKKR